MTTNDEKQSYFKLHPIKAITGYIIVIILCVFQERLLTEKDFGFHILGLLTVLFTLCLPIFHISSNISQKMKEYPKATFDAELRALKLDFYKIDYYYSLIGMFGFYSLVSIFAKEVNFSFISGLLIVTLGSFIQAFLEYTFSTPRSLDEGPY